MVSATCASTSSAQALMTLIAWLTSRQAPAHISQEPEGDGYDFVIIGAGSAGCVVANRLTENPKLRVLLLEAGENEPRIAQVPAFDSLLFQSDIDWSYRTESQEGNCGGQGCYLPRGKVLGGSSVINGMTYMRGYAEDYDHWEALGNNGWGYNQVLPLFKKSENNLDESFANDTMYHATGGYQSVGRFPYQGEKVHTIVEAYKELGYEEKDFNANPGKGKGVMIVQAFQNNGERRSSNRAFLEPIMNRPNLTVITAARATKILIHKENNTAYGVEYTSEKYRNVTRRVSVCKEVIVSAGVFGSPQLLLLSGIGPKADLEKLDIPVIQDLQVGKNLQDHIGTTGLEYLLKDPCALHEGELQRDAKNYSQKTNRGPWSSTGALQIVAFDSTPDASYPDIQYYVLPKLVGNQSHAAATGSPWCYYNKITLVGVNLRPKSRGYVALNSTDPYDRVKVYTNSFQAKEDLDAVVYGCKLAMQLEDTNTFKNAGITLDRTPLEGCTHLEYGTDEYLECISRVWTHSVNHPIGTNKMGPSTDPNAVVSPELKVHGVSGLRVIDSSTFPFIVSGNVNAGTVMIAEKGSEMIKNEYNYK